MSRVSTVVLSSLALMAGPVILAHEGDDDRRREELFESQFVRVADLRPGGMPSGTPLGPLFGAAGNDPLVRGEVELFVGGQLEVEVRGAFPSGLYNILFCRFGQPPGLGCVSLGELSTDDEGDGEAIFSLVAPETTLAGVFILTRGGLNQFVSGFQLPPLAEIPPVAGVEVELKGRVAFVNLANNSFRLEGLNIDIFAGTSTRFRGVNDLAGLRLGVEVEVRGFSRPDGTIFATRIDVKERDGDDRRGRGNGRDDDDREDNHRGRH